MCFSWSLIALTVYAAETMLSPVADEVLNAHTVTKPDVSFSQLQSPSQSTLNDILGLAIAPSTIPPPAQIPRTTRQKKITVAALGDSMIDTLGPDLPHLKKILGASYPKTEFRMLNYGVGGTNIEYGIQRLTSDYTYLDRTVPSLVSQFPDVVIVESFAYNPFSFDEGALDKHWLALATILDTVKHYLPKAKIVIAATIAPDENRFGDGAPNIAEGPEGKRNKVHTIIQYLDSTVKFARSQNMPLADAFHPSLDENGNGKEEYINPGDHIHYSDAGREFFSKTLADTIIDNRLLE